MSRQSQRRDSPRVNEDEDEEEEYIVEAIRDWRYNLATRRREFFIKWKGYSEQDNTWEPEEHLHCPNILEEFKANLSKEDRRCFYHDQLDGLTGFQRHATYVRCIGTDGPHSDDEEGSDNPDKQPFYCLIQFHDSEGAEEVSLMEFWKHQPEEAFKFIEQRMIWKS